MAGVGLNRLLASDWWVDDQLRSFLSRPSQTLGTLWIFKLFVLWAVWICSALSADWRPTEGGLHDNLGSALVCFFAAFLPFKGQNQDVCYMMQFVAAEWDFFLFLGWTSNVTHLNLFFPAAVVCVLLGSAVEGLYIIYTYKKVQREVFERLWKLWYAIMF